MGVGIFVCLLNPLMHPVGAPESADFSFCVEGIKDFNDCPGLHVRIVPMKKVDIEIVRMQVFGRLCKIFPDFLLVDPLFPKHTGMATLGQQHDFIPVAPCVDPLAQGQFSSHVVSCAVKCCDPSSIDGIQKFIRILAGQIGLNRCAVKIVDTGLST